MSEINKVYKKYGESTGHIYLVLLANCLVASMNNGSDVDQRTFAEIKTKADRYIIKEYGQGFCSAYTEFAKENVSNKPLIKELMKRRSEFVSKAIVDAITKSESVQISKQVELGKPLVNNEETAKPHTLSKEQIDSNDPKKMIPTLKGEIFLDPHNPDNWKKLGLVYLQNGDEYRSKICIQKAEGMRLGSSNKPQSSANKNRSVQTMARPDVNAKKEDSKLIAQKTSNQDNDEEGYYFENTEEFLLYVKESGGKKNIKWLSGDNYINEFKKGYQLFDQMQYQKAIDTYKNALKLNPVGVVVRMELCTAYCKMRKLSEARDMLQSTEPYLYNNILIAKYYRLHGFLQVEDQEYRTAAYCYQYSLFFSDHPSVQGELKFIAQKIGNEILNEKKDRVLIEMSLRQAGIKVITKSVMDDEDHTKSVDGNDLSTE